MVNTGAMSESGDSKRQVRLWPVVASELDEIVARSVTPASLTDIANMAIQRGLKILEKEIALNPKPKHSK